MRIAFVVSPRADHQRDAALALSEGVNRCGDEASIYSSGQGAEVLRTRPDAIACWGWRNGEAMKSLCGTQPVNILVMERAYVADRFTWTSLGWNGLNGRAQWPSVEDGGARWSHYFEGMLKAWRGDFGGYALLLGQVVTDMACRNIDHLQWLKDTAQRLRELGHQVRYRPHPKKGVPGIPGTPTVDGSLEQSLSAAAFAVTWNSNSGVDAVLAGVPAVTMDIGSMAYEVTSHSLENPIMTPDREAWAWRLAWRQWLPQELADGSAWQTVRSVVA